MKIPHTHRNTRRALAALALLAAGAAATAQVAQRGARADDADDTSVIKLASINVTAMREARHFYETPASVVTLSQADIVATGADNVFEALRFADGITFHEQLPHGQFFSTMTSKNIIRGSQYGTLMLVDGMPANTSGYYFTGDIPVQVIKSTEVLRGASSSLYGADAAGGIINMITGHPDKNSATISLGSESYRNYSFALRQNWSLWGQTGGVSAVGVYNNLGNIKNISDSGSATGACYEFGGAIKRTGRVMLSQGPWSVYWQRTYTVNKAISHKRTNWVTDWSDAGRVTIYDDTLTNDYIRANGHGENWNLNLFTNLADFDWKNIAAATGNVGSGADIKGKTFGGDFQYQLKFDNPYTPDFLLGTTFMHDTLNNTDYGSREVTKVDRDNIAVFARASKTFLDSWTAIVSLRETLYFGDKVPRQNTTATASGDFNAFTPQFQLLKVFPHRISAYANVGRSFSVHSLKTMYTDGPLTAANPDLEPDDGWTYEVGVKWEGKRTLASLDVFYMDFDRLTSWVNKAGTGQPKEYAVENNPFRNPGIELSVAQKIGSAFTIEAGAVYNEPEQQKAGNKKWVPVIGKVQANLRARWAWNRYSASFNVAYLGHRKNPNSGGTLIYETREMVPATLKAGVSFGRFGALSASVDNLFNRRDIVTHPTSATKYFASPRSFRVTYELTF
jgi:iron complex outermembrane receptor protein